jgi:ThiF family
MGRRACRVSYSRWHSLLPWPQPRPSAGWWPPLALTFIDGDTVERRNVGRQLFTAREVGKPKAQVLAERLNAAFGLGIVAVPTMATAGLLTELHPGYQTIGVLVGAVDTASGRRALHDALARSAWRIWLDVGNERDWGTVMLGTATEARQLRGTALPLLRLTGADDAGTPAASRAACVSRSSPAPGLMPCSDMTALAAARSKLDGKTLIWRKIRWRASFSDL